MKEYEQGSKKHAVRTAIIRRLGLGKELGIRVRKKVKMEYVSNMDLGIAGKRIRGRKRRFIKKNGHLK